MHGTIYIYIYLGGGRRKPPHGPFGVAGHPPNFILFFSRFFFCCCCVCMCVFFFKILIFLMDIYGRIKKPMCVACGFIYVKK
jgi:hypothetical protein